MSESQASYRVSLSPTEAPALIVGLDPGAETGFATYDPTARRLESVTSLSFWAVHGLFETSFAPTDSSPPGPVVLVVIEDARKLPIFGKHDGVRGRRRDRLARNVGRIDRDVDLWLRYLSARGYRVLLVEPQREKWSGERLRQVTRYEGRTNQHGRDAARLVWGRSGRVLEFQTNEE